MLLCLLIIFLASGLVSFCRFVSFIYHLNLSIYHMAYYLVHFYVVWLYCVLLAPRTIKLFFVPVENVVFEYHDSGGFIYSVVMSTYCSDGLFCHIILFLFYYDGLKCDSVW